MEVAPRSVNLLPPEKAAGLTKEVWRRLLVFYGKVFITLLAIFAVELEAMQIAFQVEAASLNQEEALARELKEFLVLEDKAETITMMLNAAQEFFIRTAPVAPLINEVLAVLPEEIVLTQVRFVRSTKRIELIGRSETRHAVLELEERLKTNPRIQSVEIPLASFAKARDVDFIVTMTVL